MMERKPPVAELHAKKLVKLSSHHHYMQSLFLQACDGAEACIGSCHKAQKVWNGWSYPERRYSIGEAGNISQNKKMQFLPFSDGEHRTSKLSQITGLNLSDINIEDFVNVRCPDGSRIE